MDACGAELEEPDWEHGEKGEALYVGHYCNKVYGNGQKTIKKEWNITCFDGKYVSLHGIWGRCPRNVSPSDSSYGCNELD